MYDTHSGVTLFRVNMVYMNTFRPTEEKLARENKLPSLYKKYVDDTLALVRDLSEATDLLTCLNEAHPSIQFTIERETNDWLPFIGIEIIKVDGSLETHVYRKKTNKGFLLHYQSHVDSRYKRLLLRTMFDRAKRLSSTQAWLPLQECKNLKKDIFETKISWEAYQLSY